MQIQYREIVMKTISCNDKGSLGCGKPSGTLSITDVGEKFLIIGRA